MGAESCYMGGNIPCHVGMRASAPIWCGRAVSIGHSIALGQQRAEPMGRIPPPHAARLGEGLHASGRHLAPIMGPGQAPPVPGCGATAEHGQCGMERNRLRSHEKLPSPAVQQDRGRGNGRARRTSARSCSRFNELWFNEWDRG